MKPESRWKSTTFLYNRGIVTIDQKWLNIRKVLYRQTMEQVRFRLGRTDGEIRRSMKDYQNEISRRWKVSHRDELFDSIQRSQMIFLGDFHALQQSQKAQLRIIKKIEFSQDRPMVIAVECIDSTAQKSLDQFISGQLTEEDFLRKVAWSKKWGFPWQHYRSLFLWAREKKVRLIGLNRVDQKCKLTLKVRDHHMGNILNNYHKDHPKHQIIVIVGDLHLHSGSLMKCVLAKNPRMIITRVFQNAEHIYFRLLKKNLMNQVDVVRFARHDFCLMSVAPWVKWQNYLLYLEHHYDVDLDEEDDVLDYTDHLVRYIRILESDLGLHVPKNDFSVYTANDQALWGQIADHFQSEQRKMIERMIEDDQSFYLPELKIAYLARASVNHAASLGMQYVYFTIHQIQRFPFHFPNDFYRLIWLETISYFGSKLINPKRKTDTLADMKANLTKKGLLEVGKEPLQLAIAQKMSEMMYLTNKEYTRKLPKPHRKWSFFIAAQLLGSLLGEKLYYGYSEKYLSKNNLMKLFNVNIGENNFEMIYLQMIEIIESIPQPFKTKNEKL